MQRAMFQKLGTGTSEPELELDPAEEERSVWFEGKKLSLSIDEHRSIALSQPVLKFYPLNSGKWRPTDLFVVFQVGFLSKSGKRAVS